MSLIKRIEVRNFKGFRKQVSLETGRLNYLIGPNNSGKSALLQAVNLFFNHRDFKGEYLNLTELRSKQKDSNRCDIALSFNASQVRGPSMQSKLKSIGISPAPRAVEKFQITKSFHRRDGTQVITSVKLNDRELTEQEQTFTIILMSAEFS